MFKNVYLFIIINLINTTQSHLDADFLKDFLNAQIVPIKLHFFGCYDIEFRKNFLKTSNKHLISFKTINSPINILQTRQEQTFVLDSNCLGFENVLKQAQISNLFSYPFRWIFIGNKNDISVDLNILIDSRFYLITKSFQEDAKNNYVIDVKAIYKVSKTSTTYIENHLGRWDKNNLFFKDINLIRDRYNMYQTIVNVSCVITHKDTWKHMWDYRNNHIDVQSKISYILSHTILHSMNATGNYLVRNSWGFRNASTGLYDGMVGDVQRHKVELGGTGAFTTIDRIEFADYIAPIYKSKASFMFRAPPLSSVSNVLTLPFTKQVWMASFFLSILICTVMYIISKWEWSEDDFKITFEGKSDVLLPSFIESFVFSLGAICQQGCKVEPKSVAGRISALVSLLIFLFLYTSYSANIVALLQSTSDSINTIDDLLNSRIQLGMELMPYNHYFKLSYGVRKQLYDTKIEPKGSSPNFLDIDAGMKKVREEFYGFYVENSRAYKVVSETFLEHEKCSLRGVPYINFGDTWITMAKKSSYKKLVKYGFRKAFESGIQNREIRKLYVSKPVCHTSESSFGSVGLKDSYYAFVIFAIGIGTALMLLILEMVINKKQQELITTWKSVQNYVNQNVIEKLNQI